MKIYTLLLLLLSSSSAFAGVFELGGSYSYSHSTYNGGSYTYMQSWATSLGYYFTEESEVEFSYQDTSNHEFVPGVQDLFYEDRVYSINFLYHFFDDESRFKPYLRTGVGQLNRDATGTYEGGFAPPGRLDQVTVILGAGMKAKISSRLALKGEFTTYLVGGSVSTWKDNVTLNIGGSIYF